MMAHVWLKHFQSTKNSPWRYIFNWPPWANSIKLVWLSTLTKTTGSRLASRSSMTFQDYHVSSPTNLATGAPSNGAPRTSASVSHRKATAPTSSKPTRAPTKLKAKTKPVINLSESVSCRISIPRAASTWEFSALAQLCKMAAAFHSRSSRLRAAVALSTRLDCWRYITRKT